MKNYSIIPYAKYEYYQALKDFETAIRNSELKYSLLNLSNLEKISMDDGTNALLKATTLCNSSGINESDHFRQIYIYDTNLKVIILDWRMSLNGLNLVLLQLPLIKKEKESWLYKLSH